MAVTDPCTAQTSATFLQQLRTRFTGPLIMVWNNGPAHRGDALRAYLATPDLQLRLVRLPAYSPDFNADEAIWDWGAMKSRPTPAWAATIRFVRGWDSSSAGWLNARPR